MREPVRSAPDRHVRPVLQEICLLNRHHLVPLLVILALGASLRLLWIRTPLLDGHRWRQVDTAAIARNLHETRFNVFYPQVDWGGRQGYVESEFPLMAAITALSYKVFGQQDYYGRLVSVVFSTATIAATYALAAELMGGAAGLAAAFLIAVSPAAVFFGRTFMPDSTMLFFWVFGVFAFVRYLRTDQPRWLWLGSASAALACLAKIPAVMMLAPIAGAAWHARGRKMFRDPRLLVALAVPLVVTIAWYVHAFFLYRQTGLTFGILVHPAKTYPPTVAPGPWQYAFSKYSTLNLIGQTDFYRQMLGRLHHFLLLPWGLAGALIGGVMWKRSDGRLVADAWLASTLAFVLVMGEANISHEYYQLPVVPLAGLYFGALARSVCDRQTLTRGKQVVVLLLVAASGVTGFYFSGVIVSHFRPENLDIRMFEAGRAVERVVPADALTIVVDDYGVTSPMLLYFAHRKGWSFGAEDVYPQVIDGLRRQGATFFATTTWSAIERSRPDTAAYLTLYRRLELSAAPPDTAVFDISTVRP